MRAVSQVAVIGAVVATLFYVPAALIVALVLRLAGVSLAGVATFGGFFNTFFGLFAWWLIAFGAACIYAACAFPWGDKVLAWPKKR
jgi:hypothetical protein